MLTFVGLGLYDERSVTVEAGETLQHADRVFAEFYTSELVGTTTDRLEYAFETKLEVLDRETVEQHPDAVLDAAEDGDAVFATAGDPMVATTHVDLRLRAEERGIDTRVVHGTTARTAACSLTGLQNYRFGKETTLPFPAAHGDGEVPDSVVRTVQENADRDLHTLVYLDIKVDDPHWDREATHLTADRAAELLAEPLENRLAVGIARAGSATPRVDADRLSALADRDFGRPLHLLVIPAGLHDLERRALAEFGDAPADVLEAVPEPE